MIALIPNCGFLSETSRMIAIATALRARGEAVVLASQGGPYAHLLDEAGFDWTPLPPGMDSIGAARFLEALLSMGRGDLPMYDDASLRLTVDREAAFLREVGAELVVTGFNLPTYLSSRLADVPMATSHGGAFVAPVMEAGLCPVAVNPRVRGLDRLPRALRHRLANIVPRLLKGPVQQLNRLAKSLDVEPLPSLASLMSGDLTLVTELPEVLGLSRQRLESWRPSWRSGVRRGTTMRYTGPLFARLDREVPPAVDAFLAQGEPVVYLTPTSVTTETLRALVAAVSETGARVLVGATIHDVADLQDVRTMVAGILPNHRILPRVSAAVMMGGQGSVQSAMAAGVPFVGLPYHGEQELNVALAERLGVGLRVSPEEIATGALTAALRRVLDEPSFRARASVVKGLYANVDGADAAAAAIVGWLAERGPRRGARTLDEHTTATAP